MWSHAALLWPDDEGAAVVVVVVAIDDDCERDDGTVDVAFDEAV